MFSLDLDPPLSENEDPVGLEGREWHGGENEAGSSGKLLFKKPYHLLLGARIERSERIIEEDYGGIVAPCRTHDRKFLQFTP